jgi:hypothetical protein
MRIELTPEQIGNQLGFRLFSKEHIAPHAAEHDREQRVSNALIREVAEKGYLLPFLPGEWGGQGMEMVSYGLLHEEVGKACSSVRSLLTVHDMVGLAIYRWGSSRQRHTWLSRLARGEIIGALAISEPNAGSDAGGVETVAIPRNGAYVLSGKKKWITFGQIADLFLVLAKCENKPTAFLVERGTPGFSTRPINDVLGTRGSMLAELTFDDCVVLPENLVARKGFGMSSVALTALGLGRYSIAWGSVGIAQACLDSCMRYVSQRRQFGALLKEHQLIQQMITEMITDISAARLLCCQAGYLKDMNDPREIKETFTAKYFASTIAMRAATNAVQIHGANGCSSDYPVERYLRDAKVMEIIEGSTQIQQITIAKFGFQEYEQHLLKEENINQAIAVSV